MAKFPIAAEQVTPDFLSDVLGIAVSGCDAHSIGAGLVGDSARIRISYANGITGPATLAAKFPAADPTSRGTAQAMRLYEREVGFYQHVAPHIETRTPAIHFAQHDPESGDFLLLMEDCGPAQQGDQLASCSAQQARTAVEELAALHGGTLTRPELQELPFLEPNPDVSAWAASQYEQASATFISLYADRMPQDLLKVVTQVASHTERLFAHETPGSRCVTHGDFRLDNMLFAIRDGTEPMVTLDWQTVVLGHPLADLGYFMGAGIGTALRHEHEADLLAAYQGALTQYGGPDFGDIRQDAGYARGALHGLSTAVFSAAFVEHNDRSEAIFQSMAEGAAALIQELDAIRVLED